MRAISKMKPRLSNTTKEEDKMKELQKEAKERGINSFHKSKEELEALLGAKPAAPVRRTPEDATNTSRA